MLSETEASLGKRPRAQRPLFSSVVVSHLRRSCRGRNLASPSRRCFENSARWGDGAGVEPRHSRTGGNPERAGSAHGARWGECGVACPPRPCRCDIRPLRRPHPRGTLVIGRGIPLRPPGKSDRMQRNPENSPRSAPGALRLRSGRAVASCCIPVAFALPSVRIGVAFCPHQRCFPSASESESCRAGLRADPHPAPLAGC